MASHPSSPTPFWATDPAKRLADSQRAMADRVAEINRISDPGTFADEIRTGSKWLLYASLLFTGALCFFSYQFFLERFLSPGASFVAAALVTALVEIGKQRIGLMAVRMPFLIGFRQIFASATQFVAFVALVGFTVVVFLFSVYNSTNGAAHYAETTATERTESAFVPNTADIDADIAATRATINNAPMATWKGRKYYQSPKTVASATKTLEGLQAQKAQRIAEQRADFERQRGHNDNAAAHSGQIALLIGGWLEGFQFLLILIMASCEGILARRAGRGGAPAPSAPSAGIGFRTTPSVATAYGTSPTPPTHDPSAGANPDRVVVAGFGSRSVTTASSVPQMPQSVPQAEAQSAVQHTCEVLLRYLQTNVPHYANPHAVAETVTTRIQKKVTECQALLPAGGVEFWGKSRKLMEVLLSKPELQQVPNIPDFITYAYGTYGIEAWNRCQYNGASVADALQSLDYYLGPHQ